MTLLSELYTIPSDSSDSDEQANRTFVGIQGTLSFAHPAGSDQFYQQLLKMPQFQQLLEQTMTKAFAATVNQFISSAKVPVEQASQNWRDNFEGTINIANITVRGEH